MKIGWSGNIGARLRNMETGRATPLEYLGVIEDAEREVEAEFHKAYDALRVRGEWFRLEGRLLEVLWPAMSGEDWGLDEDEEESSAPYRNRTGLARLKRWSRVLVMLDFR